MVPRRTILLPLRTRLFLSSALILCVLACNDDKSVGPPLLDTTPPAAIGDLSGHATSRTSVILGWTAPGDDGTTGQASRYDVRYSTTVIDEESWRDANVASSPPTPQVAGRLEQFAIQGLALGAWHFAVRSIDESGNAAAVSNDMAIDLIDTVAPDAIDDLAASARSTTSVTLTWSATGNDGSDGQAAAYDLRYSESAITEQTWGTATRIDGTASPGLPGATESFEVTGLSPGTLYSFAVKALDSRPNESPISNVVSESTLSPALTQITFSDRSWGAFGPEWSPDGARILFQADWGSEVMDQAYVVDASGGEPVRLTSLLENINSPEWSPDGSKIAFTRTQTEDETARDLMIMDATPNATPTLLVPSTGLRIGTLTWSPDGSKIAYTVVTTPPPSFFLDLYVVRLDGGEPARLLTGSSLGDIDWSPDGTRIACGRGTADDRDIWIVPVDGEDPVQLTTGLANDDEPVWSPDGSRIAFSSDRTGNLELWIMSSTGENLVQLTHDPGWDQSPCWSPDGTKLAFSNFKDQIGNIWVLTLR